MAGTFNASDQSNYVRRFWYVGHPKHAIRHQETARNKNLPLCLQLHLGYRGLTIGTSRNGAAAECLELLGGGLSKDQLRWMYSSFSVKELIATGWDPSSVPFLDEDDNTHLWSEMHENCTSKEISLAAEENNAEQQGNTGAIAYFNERILGNRGEVMRDHFSSNVQDDLDEFLQANGNGISFFHLFDMFDKEYQKRNLLAVGIKNKKGIIYMPTVEYFQRRSYPLMRRFYIGVNKDPLTLESTRPLLEFGYSAVGTEILKEAGYWPVHESDKVVMYSLMGSSKGLEADHIEEHCGRLDANLQIAGSETVLPVLQGWSNAYKLHCPLAIELEEGGSSVGASSVCSSTDSGFAIDIAMMSRDFDPATEAVPRPNKDFIYDCLVDEDDEPRSVIQIDVALDGISIMFGAGGMGEKCVSLLGGLTMDQLRWMYTSYSDDELEKSGWDPRSLKNSDFDSSTHLWSELDDRCPNEEIRLLGDNRGDGSYVIFSEIVLKDYARGEHIADSRPKRYIEAAGIHALMPLLQYEDSVSYIGYHYYVAHPGTFWAAPLATKADTLFVAPSEDSIADGSYPLTRSIFVTVLNDADVLEDAIALLDLGFSHPELLHFSGFAPIVGDRMKEMMQRMIDGPYTSTYQIEDEQDEESNKSIGLILGIVAAVIVASGIVGFVYFKGSKRI